MINKLFYILFIGAGLAACSSVSEIVVDADLVPVTGEIDSTNRIDSLIAPYRSELKEEMGTVLAQSAYDFVKDRPNGALNNWSADALLTFFKDSISGSDPIMALLNTGGLRSTINKGAVTLGDIFKLMPFDNEVVLVKLPKDRLKDIAKYISISGGEPIAGAHYDSGQFFLNEDAGGDTFWVVTSDYLFNGGDKMTFFNDPAEVIWTSVLLRDVFVYVAKKQGNLIYSDQERIKL